MAKHGMHRWAGMAALSAYGLGYLGAWSIVWSVPVADRDGIEWGFVMVMTLPWSLFARAGGWTVVNVGAAVNGLLVALFVATLVRSARRAPPPG